MKFEKRECFIEGCFQPHYGIGFCRNHHAKYKRWLEQNGINRASRGEPMRWIHSTLPTIETEECIIWPFARTKKGYGKLLFDGKTSVASRYVCQVFHGEPPDESYTAAHSCGKGHEGCVNPRHLSWKTQKDNLADRIEHGTNPYQDQHWGHKLSAKDIAEIRIRLAAGETHKSIAKLYGVSRQIITEINRGNHWSAATDDIAA